jgi:hypothetical protein
MLGEPCLYFINDVFSNLDYIASDEGAISE